MSESTTRLEKILRAQYRGHEAGHAAGSWVIDGNTTTETAERILKGYDEGDPEIMDMVPSPSDAITEALDDLLEGLAEDDPGCDLLDAFGEAFELAYWAEVLPAATYIATHDVFGHDHEETAR